MAQTDSIRVEVYFPVKSTVIDPDYMGNGSRLEPFIGRLLSLASNSERISSISIVGNASPEGPGALNNRLAADRALALDNYIRNFVNLDGTQVSLSSNGIDWEALDRAVGESSLPNAARVQYIIRHEPEYSYDANGRLVKSRKQTLMNLEGGRTWRWMTEHIFPQLRSASADVVCYIETVEAPQPAVETVATETAEIIFPDVAQDMTADSTGYLAPEEIASASLRYPVVALRTNMLVPFLNAGIEVPVSKNWSIGADYYFPWIWPAKSNKNCFELIFVSAEARYWFNPSKNQPLDRNYLLGHSVGLYGAWGYYDFEHNWSGHQGHGWSAGVDYLYALPIAKGKLHLEFEIALGALWSPKAKPYKVYESGGHLIKEPGHTKNFFYVGPTKVGISLVVPINRTVKQSAPLLP